MEQNAESVFVKEEEKRFKGFKKSVLSMVLFAIVTFGIFSAQTLAYFTQSVESEKNKITAGGLDIEIVEVQNGASRESALTEPVIIMPATSVERAVKVQNTGDLPVYVRIRIEKTTNKAEDEIPEGWQDFITCNFYLDDEATAEVAEGPWIYRNGYYYYSVSLAAGAVTEALFDLISFSPNMGNQFAGSEIRLSVICEATQANGNADVPMDAVGWPA